MKIRVIVILLLLIFISFGCNNYGKKKEFGYVRIFYTSSIQETEVDALGKFLTKNGFGDSIKVDFQLNREANVYQVKVIIGDEKKTKDEETIDSARALGFFISTEVFDNFNVEVHLCDGKFKTLKTIKAY